MRSYDFIIEVSDNLVRVNRVVEGGLEIIRFSGESYLPQVEFWERFKEKIEYDSGNESLAFVIISDREDFVVDSSIIVSDHFLNDNGDILRIVSDLSISKNVVISSYPRLDIPLVNDRPVKKTDDDYVVKGEDIFESDDVIDANSMQAFYRKKTKDFKHR